MEQISFICYGHPNVLSKHKSTLEFTTDSELTLRGDCILGVKASVGPFNLPEELKIKLREKESKVKMLLEVDGLIEEIEGTGHPELLLSDKVAIIIRKSNFICSRTLMINANKAAQDVSEQIKNKMKDKEMEMKVTIHVE
jgi:hypothetical protein